MGFSEKMKDVWRDPKQRVAFSSVIAAIFLVTFKLYVGLVTNSLGILSEALHSGLDFVAAAITMVAVVSSAKPADEDHQFGHGKVENFSALAETLLLLLTCFWIFMEAWDRIQHGAEVDADWISFLVMSVSIVVDVSRSRALYKAAEEYHSQALEADALHFSTDILSSAVVIAGLAFVYFGFPIGDPLAAIGVAVIVVVISLRLGKRTMDHLLDKAPEGATEKIRERVDALDGISCDRVRARTSGPYSFVDVRISLDHRMPLDASKEAIENVRGLVREVMEDADVVVEIVPRADKEEDLHSVISLMALKVKGIKGVHKIEVHNIDGRTCVDLHIELDPAMTVKEAHDLVDRFELDAKAELGDIDINTHIETHEEDVAVGEDVTEQSAELVSKVLEIVRRYPRIRDCRDVVVRKAGGKLSVNMVCTLKEDETVARAHDLSTMLERTMKSETGVDHMTIHVEPGE